MRNEKEQSVGNNQNEEDKRKKGRGQMKKRDNERRK